MALKEELLLGIRADNSDFKAKMGEVSSEFKNVDTEIKNSNTSMGKFIAIAGGLGVAALAIKGIGLAISGIKTSIGLTFNEMEKWVTASADAEINQRRLEASIIKTNSTLDAHKQEIDAAKQAMWEYAGVAGEDFTNILADLNNYTGDVTKSIAAMPAVLDLVASGMMTMEAATRNVGKTFGGYVGELGEYVTGLKELTPEALKAGGAIQVLAKYQGQATGYTQTFKGSIASLNSALKDTRSVLGEGIRDALTPKINEFARALVSANESGKLDRISQLLGSIANDGIGAIDKALGIRAEHGMTVTDKVIALLETFEGYTKKEEFITDMTNIADVVRSIGSAATGTFQAIRNLIDLWESIPEELRQGLTYSPFRNILTGSNIMEGFPGMATGGTVPGPDLHRDSMLVPLRGREYVLVPEAADMIGRGKLDLLNSRFGGSSGPGLAGGGDVEKWMKNFEYLYGGSGRFESGKFIGARKYATRGFENALRSMQSMEPAQLYWWAKQWVETQERYGSIDMGVPITGQFETPSNMYRYLMRYAEQFSSHADRENAHQSITAAAWEKFGQGGARDSQLMGLGAAYSQVDPNNPIFRVAQFGGQEAEAEGWKTAQPGAGYDAAIYGNPEAMQTYLPPEIVSEMAGGKTTPYKSPDDWEKLAKSGIGQGGITLFKNKDGSYTIFTSGTTQTDSSNMQRSEFNTLNIATKNGMEGIVSAQGPVYGPENITPEIRSQINSFIEENAEPNYKGLLHQIWDEQKDFPQNPWIWNFTKSFIKEFAREQYIRMLMNGMIGQPTSKNYDTGGIISGIGRQYVPALAGEEVVTEQDPRHLKNIYKFARSSSGGSGSAALPFNKMLGPVNPDGSMGSVAPVSQWTFSGSGKQQSGGGSMESWLNRGVTPSQTTTPTAPAGAGQATITIASDNRQFAEYLKQVIHAGMDIDLQGIKERLQEVRQ